MLDSIEHDVYEHMFSDTGLYKSAYADPYEIRPLYTLLGLASAALFHTRVAPITQRLVVELGMPRIEFRVQKTWENRVTRCMGFIIEFLVVTNDADGSTIQAIGRRIDVLFGERTLYNSCTHRAKYVEACHYVNGSDTGVVFSNDGLYSRMWSYAGTTNMSRDQCGLPKFA